MTDLRDARFKQALDAAPDADARPASAVAQAIRAAARSALPVPVAHAAPLSWWQRLWRSTGQYRAPWSAAFASVLLAVLITVMWVREPIPDARPVAAAPAASTAPVPTPTPAPAKSAQDAKVSAGAAKAPARAATVQPEPALPPMPATPATAPARQIADAPALAQGQQADQALAQHKAATAFEAEEQARGASRQKSADSAGQLRESRSEMARSVAPLSAAPMAVAPAADAAAPLPAGSQASVHLAGLEDWSALSVEMPGRNATLDRAQGQRLFMRMQRQVRRMAQMSGPATTAPVNEPTLRLTLLSQGQSVATLVLWTDTALWQRPGQPGLLSGIGPAEAQALLQPAQQALAAGNSAPPD